VRRCSTTWPAAVEKRIDTGAWFATAENMESADVKPLLPSDAAK